MIYNLTCKIMKKILKKINTNIKKSIIKLVKITINF